MGYAMMYIPARSNVKQLISEKQALERRIDELCAEVERLRKAKDTMRGDAFEIGAMLVKARDENAKLRELVRDMFEVISRNNSWWDGTAKDTSRLSDRMRELGIEVRHG